MIVLLASLTYGIIEAPNRGWSSPAILAAFAASAVALLGLLLYEPRREEPLIDLRFFRSIPFASSIDDLAWPRSPRSAGSSSSTRSTSRTSAASRR